MESFFGAHEIWALSSDQDSLQALQKTFDKPYLFKKFVLPVEVHTRLAEVSAPKPSLIVVDVFEDHASEFFRLLETEKNELGKLCPVLILAQEDDLPLVKEFCKKADCDYLLKPIKRTEAEIRLKILLRSQARHIGFTLALLRKFGSELTSTELKILFCFLNKHGEPISREELIDLVWGDSKVHKKTLDVHLFNLRKKLAPVGCHITSGRGGVWAMKQVAQQTASVAEEE